MEKKRDDLLLIAGITCGIIIFISGLLGLIVDFNNERIKNFILLISGILQVIIGYNYSIKNKKKYSLIFYCFAMVIFGLFIISLI